MHRTLYVNVPPSKNHLFTLAITLSLASCDPRVKTEAEVITAQKVEESAPAPAPERVASAANASNETTPATSDTPSPAVPSPLPPTSPDCQVVSSFPNDEPVFLPKTKVMLTRLTGSCMTPDGKKGHLPTSGWMAMGFPCTGGEGRIDWKGTNYLAPKMVSFLLDTSCPMAPADPQKLRSAVLEEAALPARSTMIAFNPFVVQYWEVVDYDDSDATFSVDLRNNRSLKDGWKKFQAQTPYKVLLVGRENAWVPGNHMYAVNAEIHLASRNRFTLSVVGAHVLKGDELNAVRTRCEALKPERECGKVF